jgi:histidine ammonia-lyase
MIAQYTAASIVSQNKTLCTPASADSIVSCNGQEDHVSMAANAATKARRIIMNLEGIARHRVYDGSAGTGVQAPRCAPVRLSKPYWSVTDR